MEKVSERGSFISSEVKVGSMKNCGKMYGVSTRPSILGLNPAACGTSMLWSKTPPMQEHRLGYICVPNWHELGLIQHGTNGNMLVRFLPSNLPSSSSFLYFYRDSL